MIKCPTCGDIHENIKCPLIKAFEYYEDGENKLKRIEYFSPAEMLQRGPSVVDFRSLGTRQ